MLRRRICHLEGGSPNCGAGLRLLPPNLHTSYTLLPQSDPFLTIQLVNPTPLLCPLPHLLPSYPTSYPPVQPSYPILLP